MPEFLTQSGSGAVLAPLTIMLRLALAAVLGGLVALIYRYSTRAPKHSVFATTLVLLSVLIAMVSQVIGDNVALAFSLVGALSIVRFRTVVRDTRDTTFVIFSVVIGMAAGGAHWWVAGVGMTVVAAAAMFMAWREPRAEQAPAGERLVLRLKTALGVDADALLAQAGSGLLATRKLQSAASSRAGTALEYAWEIALTPGTRMDQLLRVLSTLDGLQDVRIERPAREEP